MWYNLAAYNGKKHISGSKIGVARYMISSEVAKAQEMSSRCLESGYTDC